MAKKMKRLLALTLALSMSMSMLSFRAFAADGELPDDVTPTSSSDILPDGKQDEGAVSGTGTPVESKDPGTGNKVITVESTVTWGSTSGGTDVDNIPMSSDPDREPIDSETTEITENPEGPDEKLTGSTTSTSVSGSETTTKIDKYDDKGRLESETTIINGSETTTQSTTTKKEDHYNDRLVEEEETKKEYINGELVEVNDKPVEGSNVPDDTEIPASTQEGNWEQGGLKQEGTWTPVEGTVPDSDDDWTLQSGDGQPSELQPTQNNGTNIPVEIEDVKNGNSITINLTPGQKITNEVKVEVDVNELVAKHLTIDEYIAEQCAAIENAGDEENIVDDSGTVIGKKVTVGGVTTELTYTAQKDEDGNVIGYSVTKTVTTIAETGDIAGSEQSGAAQFPNEEETADIPASAAGLDKVVLPDDIVEGTKDVNNDKGEKIGETVTKIEQVEIDGQWYYKVTKTTTTNVADAPVTSESDRETTTQPSGSTFTKPAEKPAEIEPYENTETGNMVTVTVKKIDGGWERVYEEKNGDTVVATRTEKFFDTVVTVNATVETDPDYEIYNKTTETISTEVMYYSATVQQGEAAIESTKEVGYQKDVVTDTQYQIIQIGDAYYAYTAEMDNVIFSQDTATVDGGAVKTFKLSEVTSTSRGNGTYTLQFPGLASATNENDLQSDGTTNSSWYTPYTMQELQDLQNQLKKNNKSDDYILIGYGAFSEYNLFDDGYTLSSNGFPEYLSGSAVHSLKQFMVLGEDGITFGYCVELRAGLKLGTGDATNDTTPGSTVNDAYIYTQIGLEEAIGKNIPLKGGDTALQPLNNIIKYGYLGTTSGMGSLNAVKDQLLRYADDITDPEEKARFVEAASTLTEGEALAATQAAVWKYGNKSDQEGKADFSTLKEYLVHWYPNNNPNGQNPYTEGGANSGLSDALEAELAQDYANISAVYDMLCALANNKNVFETVQEGDLTGASIVLKEEVALEAYDDVSSAVKNAVKDTDNKVYNTDLSFTLAISNSTYNGDLIVYVYADGDTEHPVATRRIAGSGSETRVDSAVSDGNGNTTYTIEDIKLAENVNITLKLDGTQYLADGVYVYTCSNSQNFIGSTNSLKQDFEMQVDLKFNVTKDPSAQFVEKSSHDEDTYTAKRTDRKTDTYHAYKYDQHSEGSLHTEETVIENTKVYADITVSEIITQQTSATVEWNSTDTVCYTYKDETKENELKEEIQENETPAGGKEIPAEDPAENLPDENVPLEELPEEDIPLADVPKTGDASILWAAMSLISAAGLAGLSLVSKKREDEEA